MGMTKVDIDQKEAKETNRGEYGLVVQTHNQIVQWSISIIFITTQTNT